MRKKSGKGAAEEPVTGRNKRVRQTSCEEQADILTNCLGLSVLGTLRL